MSVLAALLAAAPALPLDTAGKYVAGAYIVLFAVLVIYVGIMGVRLQRMSRELAELDAALEQRAREDAGGRSSASERPSAAGENAEGGRP